MEIKKEINGEQAVISLNGWLDTKSAPDFEARLASLPVDVTSLTLDLAELEYISSAGLRQVVAAHKKMNGNLTIINVSDEIKELFRMAGFDKKLNIQ
ncbi:MAG: STAS domain-containing protein [Saccharofermentans sp.]|nr:STAS domain-containing protein [Saccharofermentans sp.]